MRLVPTPPGYIKSGSVTFDGVDILKATEKEMESIRGNQIAMIFQDPMTSLNPTMTIGKQIMEGLIKHRGMNKADAFKKAVEMIQKVGIASPESRMKQYPHQLSGGMRQRIMIAIALACAPKLLIADEPTTALDVTIQAQILELMKELQQDFGTSIILITHDLGVVADVADRVVVMYAGKVLEVGSTDEIFYQPQQPYTWGLLESMPRLDQPHDQELLPIPGAPPNLLVPPTGCPFTSRCKYAMKICPQRMPDPVSSSDTHTVLCWLTHPLANAEEKIKARGEEPNG